jgi:hypothetical protein
MQSVKCIEDCDVFFLYKRNYERIIAKRNPTCVAKMRQNVLTKIEARNVRLSTTTPISLFRSIQYRLQKLITGKRREPNPEASLSLSKSAMLKLPPRGPIIQMDYGTARLRKTKSRSFQNFAKSTNKTNETQQNNFSATTNSEIKITIEKSDNERLEAEDLFSSSSNEDFKGRIDMETTSDHALSQLEDRIKRWHFKNGCKAPFMPKFNRIDLEVTKFKKFGNSHFGKLF